MLRKVQTAVLKAEILRLLTFDNGLDKDVPEFITILTEKERACEK